MAATPTTYPLTITREELLAHSPCPSGLANFDRVCPSGTLHIASGLEHSALRHMFGADDLYWAQTSGVLPPLHLDLPDTWDLFLHIGGYAKVTAGSGARIVGGSRCSVRVGDYSDVALATRGTVHVGSESTVAVGDLGHVDAGHWADVTAGSEAVIMALDAAHVRAGYQATVDVGADAYVSVGIDSTITGGDRSELRANHPSVLQAGSMSSLTWRVWEGCRYRLHTFYTGEEGLQPNQKYTYSKELRRPVEFL